MDLDDAARAGNDSVIDKGETTNLRSPYIHYHTERPYGHWSSRHYFGYSLVIEGDNLGPGTPTERIEQRNMGPSNVRDEHGHIREAVALMGLPLEPTVRWVAEDRWAL